MTEKKTRRLDYPEATRALKRELVRAFPGTRFSVRLCRGTAHGSADVDWDGGPTGEEVHAVTDPWESLGFDAMTDSTTHREAVVEVGGERVESPLGMILLHRSGVVA